MGRAGEGGGQAEAGGNNTQCELEYLDQHSFSFSLMGEGKMEHLNQGKQVLVDTGRVMIVVVGLPLLSFSVLHWTPVFDSALQVFFSWVS